MNAGSSNSTLIARLLAICGCAVLLATPAIAQNECAARGMRTIGTIFSDGATHDALCWDQQNERACSPDSGGCGPIPGQPSSEPKPEVPSAVRQTQATISRDTSTGPAASNNSDDGPPIVFQQGSSASDDLRPATSDNSHPSEETRTKPITVPVTVEEQQQQTPSQLQIKVPEKPATPAPARAPIAPSKTETIEIVPQSTTVRSLPGATPVAEPEAIEVTRDRSAPPRRERAGELDVAMQGYYLTSSGQGLNDTTGTSVRYQNFFPSIGLVSASFEGYGSQGDFRLGDNFARLSGVSMFGQHWAFGAGDFRVSLNTVDHVFSNIFTPDMFARGFDVDMSSSHRDVHFFGGQETLMQGPRVPFRIPAPQSLMGVTFQQKFDHLSLGLRYLHTSSSESQIANHSSFFPTGHRFLTGDSLTFQALYHPFKPFRFFAEAAASKAEQQDATPQTPQTFSFVAGPEFDTKRLTFRANYIYQGNSYLPLAGYYAGDREGPFAEVQFRPFHAVQLYASASRYMNNLDRNPEIPDYHALGYSGGLSASLPWKFNASAQLSTVAFDSSAVPLSNIAASVMDNRQISFSLSRAIRRHTLRASAYELKNRVNALYTTQHLAELEDSFAWKGFVVSGAGRIQKSIGADNKNSIFYRGSARYNIKQLSVYASVEAGSDVVNKSLLATNSLSSTVIGASTPLFRGWGLQFEAFRNNLTTDLNPASIFVLEGRGVDVPMTIASLNQWSIYFRISKQIRWGSATPAESMAQFTARQIPLVGVVEGSIMQNLLAGSRGATGIPVRLDGYRTTYTDATGYFHFDEVPEGIHTIGPAPDELPADVELDGPSQADVRVMPRLRARADFAVAPLLAMTGKITAPAGVPLDGVLVRLRPSARYTTPDADGSFSFFGLREGSYEVTVDRNSLPEDVVVSSASTIVVDMKVGATPASADFDLAVEHRELPVQRVIEQRIDVGGGGMRNLPKEKEREREKR